MTQQRLAEQLVEAARIEGVELVGPGGPTRLTKTVLVTALDAEPTEHFGWHKDKHVPAGRHRSATP